MYIIKIEQLTKRNIRITCKSQKQIHLKPVFVSNWTAEMFSL